MYRYVDRDADILYFLIEYCGGGNLSIIIKQAAKQNRPIPEDTILALFPPNPPSVKPLPPP